MEALVEILSNAGLSGLAAWMLAVELPRFRKLLTRQQELHHAQHVESLTVFAREMALERARCDEQLREVLEQTNLMLRELRR